MSRNFKMVFLAAIAATVVASAAAGAQAAEFHCSVEPCRYKVKPDGSAGTKTAHQVFVVKNAVGEFATVTCNEAIGQATTSGKTATELTVTSAGFGGGCTFNGTAAVGLRMNGCDLAYGASGTFGIKGCGKAVEFEALATGCSLAFAEQTVGGVKFHNIGEEAKTTTELTVEVAALSLAATVKGSSAACGFDTTKTPISGEYKTGNIILTGETDPGGVMANAWWA